MCIIYIMHHITVEFFFLLLFIFSEHQVQNVFRILSLRSSAPSCSWKRLNAWAKTFFFFRPLTLNLPVSVQLNNVPG